MPILEILAKIRAVHWLTISGVILLVDYATGPFIQFPILFVIPVMLAAATHGRETGILVAVALPLLRLSFFLKWDLPATWLLEPVDTGVDVLILVGFALLVELIIKQQGEIRILKGMLPICGFCKRIRDEGGSWHQLESFVSQRSNAQFSHTFCEECGRKHYPDLVD
jgi:hypothetical protein